MTQLPAFSPASLGEEARPFIQLAISESLSGFLTVISAPSPERQSSDLEQVRRHAYDLGRTVAESGRAIDALNAAYRVGARIAWRRWSILVQEYGVGVADLSRLAELHFDFIDNLADASVSGHTDETASKSRLQQRRREALVSLLLDDSPAEEVVAAAKLAGWPIPDHMVAVVLPRAEVGNALPLLDDHALRLNDDSIPEIAPSGLVGLLVPVTVRGPRPRIIQLLHRIEAVVGPQEPWRNVKRSVDIAARAATIATGADRTAQPLVDADSVTAALVLHADPATRERHRAMALQPFAQLKPTTRARYEETLRSWLLNQGRREDVARQLVLHPQTVRYRMDRIRELLGDQLRDPDYVLDLVIALA